MKRKDFLKRLGIGAAGIAVVPQMLSDSKKVIEKPIEAKGAIKGKNLVSTLYRANNNFGPGDGILKINGIPPIRITDIIITSDNWMYRIPRVTNINVSGIAIDQIMGNSDLITSKEAHSFEINLTDIYNNCRSITCDGYMSHLMISSDQTCKITINPSGEYGAQIVDALMEEVLTSMRDMAVDIISS